MDAPWDDPRVSALIDLALAEDLGVGDRTTQALVPAGARARGRLCAKQAAVVCGLPLVERVFRRLGDVSVSVEAAEGTQAKPGQVLTTLEGPARVLLAGERVALNFVQHLCGIATLTRAYVERVRGTALVIRDTRKTLPGLRALAKYAVRTGGGVNHRLGLDDAILIKDNHLALGGGDVAAAVRATRAAAPALPVEIECRTVDEVERAATAAPDLILLDNMRPEAIAAAVRLLAGRIPLEVSGGVTLADLPALAALGIQLVAVGALTHSAPAADLNLKLEPLP
ncbi:MAG TPA: carboxylating nicotinate-nucleotide diphosphorylase [Verrucomicrobiae bacterium]|nr:carboxylating nicotinate-nucleotide diphosphorylase [Verrucomicrobiae bacterium]